MIKIDMGRVELDGDIRVILSELTLAVHSISEESGIEVDDLLDMIKDCIDTNNKLSTNGGLERASELLSELAKLLSVKDE